MYQTTNTFEQENSMLSSDVTEILLDRLDKNFNIDKKDYSELNNFRIRKNKSTKSKDKQNITIEDIVDCGDYFTVRTKIIKTLTEQVNDLINQIEF